MSTGTNSATPVYFVRRYEGGPLTLLARVLGAVGTPLTQASLSSITCQVFDPNAPSPTSPFSSLSPSVASTVFDTLQTGDPRWTADSTGYNFLYAVPASSFPAGAKPCRVEVTFTPFTGDPAFLAVNVSCEPLYSQGL